MKFSTNLKLKLPLLVCFLFFIVNLNGQINLNSSVTGTNIQDVDFQCRDKGDPIILGLSPANNSEILQLEFDVNGDPFYYSETPLKMAASSIMQFSLRIFDTDSNIGGAISSLPGKGPYRIGITVSGKAKFEDGTTQQIFEVSLANLPLGTPALSIVSDADFFDSDEILVRAVIIDQEMINEGCTSGDYDPRDLIVIHDWNISPVSFNFNCPSLLSFQDHDFNTEFIVSDGGFTYQLVASPPPSETSAYIRENVTEWQANFEMSDVTEEFRNKFPAITTENEVLRATIIDKAQFGGFLFSYLFDTYGFSKFALPLKQESIADNDQLGFCFKQDFICRQSTIVKTHYAKFRVKDTSGPNGPTDREVIGVHLGSPCQ